MTTPPDPAMTGSGVLDRLNRHQRRLLHIGGWVTTLVLAAVTAALSYAQVNDYIGERHSDFTMRKTALRSLFSVHEAAMRINVTQQEHAWASQQPVDPQLLRDFIANKGRLRLQRNSNIPAVLVVGDMSPSHPLDSLAPYLRLADEVSYQSGAYSRAMLASGYFYNPDGSFIGIGPLPPGPLSPRLAAASAQQLIQQAAPPLADLDDHTVVARLAHRDALQWLPPSADPISGMVAVRLVKAAAHDGHLFAIFVASYPEQVWASQLGSERPGEILRVTDPQGQTLIGRAGPAVTAAGDDQFHYRDGTFVASDVVSSAGWRLQHTFTWRTILAERWPRLLAYMLAMATVMGFVWLVLAFIDRRVFKPEQVRSQRLVESENLNRTLVSTAPFGAALLALDSGQVLLQNAVMQEYAAKLPATAPALHSQLLESLRDGQGNTQEVERELVLADGSQCELLVAGVRSKYDGRDVLLCNFKDITQRKQIQQALEQARQAADEANQAKSSFLATMSHEIRTPLNAILGNLELLQRDVVDPQQRDQLRTVSTASSTLLGIINDILDASKVEAGQMTLESIPVDVIQLGRDATAFFSPLANAKGLTLELSLGDALAPAYRGDPVRLRQILYNLVSNAIKFTDHGDVLIEIYPQDEQRSDAPLVIGVSDTGIGMSRAQLDGLFTRFSQGDASITRRYGGTGLGLALCRHLAELMGGRITVHSQAGVGSSFIVTLPLPIADAISLPAPPPPTPGRAARVLVVDDHPANRELLRLQLQTLGHHCVLAANGEEAIALASVNTVDLVLTDLNMPGMDGHALVRRLRQQHPTLPVIAITAHATALDQQLSQQAGMAQILLKPILLSTLADALAQHLPDVPQHIADTASDLRVGPLPPQVHQAMQAALTQSLQQLQADIGLAAKDPQARERIGRELHSLRGAFAMIHEQPVALACAALEQQLATGDVRTLATGLPLMRQQALVALEQRKPAQT